MRSSIYRDHWWETHPGLAKAAITVGALIVVLIGTLMMK
jgi:hypothetical protein